MRRLFLLAMVMTLAAALVTVTGCGSKSTKSELVAGDTTAVEFQIMKELVGQGMLEQDQYLIDLSLALMEEADGAVGKRAYKPVADSSYYIQIVTYDTSNYWHIFGFTASLSQSYGDTVFFEGHDSLRFSNGTGYIALPDSTVTGLNVRAHHQVGIEFPDGSISLRNHASVDLTGTYQVEFTLNGTTSDSASFSFYESDTAYCNLDAAINQSFTDLYFDSVALNHDAWPAGGTIHAEANLTLECVGGSGLSDSLNIAGGWTLNIEFVERTMLASFIHGNVVWNIVEECGPEQGTVKSRWDNLMGKIRDIKD